MKRKYYEPNPNLTNEVCEFFKENYDLPINIKVLKYISDSLQHEEVHCRIYNKFKIPCFSQIELSKVEDDGVDIFAKAIGYENDEKKHFIVKIFIVESIHLIFDFISDISHLRIINLFWHLKNYLIWFKQGVYKNE
jgi:hypothetical protein